ncbi:hypothetical protein KQI84_04270 [bacterium]|nr:hypothetical protein [bacterium]
MALLLSGCAAGYNVTKWQEVMALPRPEQDRGFVAKELARVDVLRESMDLRASRELALHLVAENPANPDALWRAARAEADGVFLHHPHEEDQRALSALSSLEYATEATRLEPQDAETNTWYAWALGTTIHLQPMFSRAGQADETLEAARAALGADPHNPTANLAMAILNYRLATLPWIAKTMSIGEPSSSLTDGEAFARLAYEEEPSIEAAIVLAQILKAQERTREAIEVLDHALAEPNRFPRDAENRDEAYALWKEWSEVDGDESG